MRYRRPRLHWLATDVPAEGDFCQVPDRSRRTRVRSERRRSTGKGFLSSVAAGPMTTAFHHMAGQAWADWLFMMALLGIGVALMLGIGLRVAAVAGVALVGLMRLAVFPPAQHLTGGAPSGSVNPFVDEHVLDALALIAVAVLGTGSRLGLGWLWARLPFVERHQSLL